MYTVIIVDDEPIIRFGLKSSINWERENLQLLGDFSNGQQALHAMENTSCVDILITDIKMPVMDGLTLMKKALRLNPKLKVVLVSSYNEFEYVREGLTHGAVDYLLKPTLEPESFLKTIQKCVQKIDEEQTIKQKLDIVERTERLQVRKKIEQEMKRILFKKETVNDNRMKERCHLPFLVVCMRMKQIGMVEEKYGFLYKSLIFEEIQECFYMEEEDGVCFPIGENELLFFIKKNGDPLAVTHQLIAKIEKQTNISFSFGYDVITKWTEIIDGYRRSLFASQRHFFYENEHVFTYRAPEQTSFEPISKGQITGLLPYEEAKIKSFLQERYQQWASEHMTPASIKSEACDILTTLFLSLDHALLLEKCSEIEACESLHDLRHQLMIKIDECHQLLSDQKSKPYSDNELLDKALYYIHEHYTQDLTLQNVADHIHISRNYFSILFKRYLEQNFIDYVIDLRVKKAKELLLHTTLKVYEVARKSGFNDVKYFSKLFKKVTGLSPGDFRIHHQK
ncbi:response regulator transcription factor [Metabacillus sp. Hm71]|uniref:response regulator transcription factor n=1 Tax=Metabacillus sp. Hm71 TaxID=3450743 RepID=UPI003F42BCDB